eukprot:gene4757-4929_t
MSGATSPDGLRLTCPKDSCSMVVSIPEHDRESAKFCRGCGTAYVPDEDDAVDEPVPSPECTWGYWPTDGKADPRKRRLPRKHTVDAHRQASCALFERPDH